MLKKLDQKLCVSSQNSDFSLQTVRKQSTHSVNQGYPAIPISSLLPHCDFSGRDAAETLSRTKNAILRMDMGI